MQKKYTEIVSSLSGRFCVRHLAVSVTTAIAEVIPDEEGDPD